METLLSTASRQLAYPISEASEVAAARRAGNELGRRLGLDETVTGKVALIITEAATNILKHAGHGEILLRPLVSDSLVGVEIIALDSGPGMNNIALSMADGTSTTGTYGVGLGAIVRQAAEFDIYTQPDQGTVLRATVWSGAHDSDAPAWEAGVVCLAMPGEEVCGDAWGLGCDATSAILMVADGLGHGLHAAEASGAAVTALEKAPDTMPGVMLQDSHHALRGSRGAAVAAARIDTLSEQLFFAGVGNIAASFVTHAKRQQMVSHSGIVGSNVRKIQEFSFGWDDEALLVLQSDGISSRWDLNHYPGLAMRHPALLAVVLYRDFSRKRDDATVVVLRQNKGSKACAS